MLAYAVNGELKVVNQDGDEIMGVSGVAAPAVVGWSSDGRFVAVAASDYLAPGLTLYALGGEPVFRTDLDVDRLSWSDAGWAAFLETVPGEGVFDDARAYYLAPLSDTPVPVADDWLGWDNRPRWRPGEATQLALADKIWISQMAACRPCPDLSRHGRRMENMPSFC